MEVLDLILKKLSGVSGGDGDLGVNSWNVVYPVQMHIYIYIYVKVYILCFVACLRSGPLWNTDRY